jgi:hypothetical protein
MQLVAQTAKRADFFAPHFASRKFGFPSRPGSQFDAALVNSGLAHGEPFDALR